MTLSFLPKFWSMLAALVFCLMLSACQAEDSANTPMIHQIFGDGTPENSFTQGIIILGQHFDGTLVVTIAPSGSESTPRQPLEFTRPDNETIQAKLPTNIQPGSFLVRVENALGADEEPLQILQGEAGQPGVNCYDGLTDVNGDDVVNQLDCLGLVGPSGPQGMSGPSGPLGVTGPSGPKGETGENGEKGDKGDQGDPGQDGQDGQTTPVPEFIGSETCQPCHKSIYDSFVQSGHPNKLKKINAGQPPVYPGSTKRDIPSDADLNTMLKVDWVDQNGQLQPNYFGMSQGWRDISYVIGGFGWLMRFMDKEGYLITGPTTQYAYKNDIFRYMANPIYDNNTWGAYEISYLTSHAGAKKKYTCGPCHTTNYSPSGHQDNLPGIVGTWVAAGVQCEECHGPASLHANAPYQYTPEIRREAEECGRCHSRNGPTAIEVSSGFIQSYEQWDELFHTKKHIMECVTCHDPHKSAKFNDGSAIWVDCRDCHFKEEASMDNWPAMNNLKCIDCHMPRADQSALASMEVYSGDTRTHLFAINPYVAKGMNDGTAAKSYLTLEFACRQCHGGSPYALDKTDQELVQFATGIHDPAKKF
jgi:hypothetical protein